MERAALEFHSNSQRRVQLMKGGFETMKPFSSELKDPPSACTEAMWFPTQQSFGYAEYKCSPNRFQNVGHRWTWKVGWGKT